MSDAVSFWLRHQFYPNVYAFSDRAGRDVRLEFIGKDTMQVVNHPQGGMYKSLEFIDVYKTHFDYCHHQRVIVINRLLYTSRRNRAAAPVARPFHLDDPMADVMSVMPLLAPGDTALVGTDEDVILAGGLLFEINLKEYGAGAKRILKNGK
ncbi:MAG: hypothetical protein IJT30_09095 [Muribaculaceae bacterium]|nr:hypothetical protein [Muribaculaceae bacterium]